MKFKYVIWTFGLLILQILLALTFYKDYVFEQRNAIKSSILPVTKTRTEDMLDNWSQYKNAWNGEVLVTYIGEKQLQLTDNYVERMRGKGDHPLLKSHPDFLTRRRRIEKLCSEHTPENDLLSFQIPGRYLYNKFYEIASCMPPKTSSTQWVEVFTQLAEFKTNFSWARTAVLEYRNLSLAYHLSDEQFTARVFQTYLKFTTVRHPWERLVSAYYDKLLDNKSVYKQKYGPEIIRYNYLEGYSTNERQLRERLAQDNASRSEIEFKLTQLTRMNGKHVNFKLTLLEFLTYITKVKHRNELEQHWRPMVLLCNPCMVHYDLVLKFETMHRDGNAMLDYVMGEKQNGPKVTYPEKQVSITKERCNKEFSNIPLDILQKLYDIYMEDFLFYDYHTSEINIC